MEVKYLKIENLKIGNTYYISKNKANGVYHSYTYGKLIEIISKNRVLIQKHNGEIISCKTDLLHKTAMKAVTSKKARDGIRRTLKKAERKNAESLVDKKVQCKVKQLGHSTYATIKKDKYIVIGYVGHSASFSTLEELDRWADSELIKLKERRDNIRDKGYKYLKITARDGKTEYYSKLIFAFTKFEIMCKPFKGDVSKLDDNLVLDRADVPEMKIKIVKRR